MRLDPTEPETSQAITSESDFFQRVRKRTYGTIHWERIEPNNESGFPDTYFINKSRGAAKPEGTIEFKYTDAAAPNLGGLMRGTQKSALIEYHQNKGTRRFILVYAGSGDVWFYNTADAVNTLITGNNSSTALAKLEEPSFVSWLTTLMNK
jgi:hypothetical protein